MTAPRLSRMRDGFIEAVAERMDTDPSIFFLSADFGSPKLDGLVARHPDRFVNVGIAEQNLINVAAGLAIEGFAVFAYAIAPFITMRCFEQVRVNLALLSRVRPMNVNLVGVGAGFSYDVSGPTHQAMEDLSIMRTLPHLEILSPCDEASAKALAGHCLAAPGIRYLRFDGKPLPAVYEGGLAFDATRGFTELRHGRDVCLVATGYMTHKALAATDLLAAQGVSAGVVDLFRLAPCDVQRLAATLAPYPAVLSVEEALAGKGGMDSLLLHVRHRHALTCRFEGLGLPDEYRFDVGNRDELLTDRGLDEAAIAAHAARLAAGAPCGDSGRRPISRGWAGPEETPGSGTTRPSAPARPRKRTVGASRVPEASKPQGT
jgi:transketolase